MEKRKRRTALEYYVDHLTETPEKMKKMHDFHVNLRNYYKKKWNAPLRAPYVQGVQVDLFRLYDTVMALGGWQKVSHQERWPDVAEMLGVEEDCLNGDHALKILYMRYLSKFEQSQTIGDIDEMMDSEFARAGRGRQISFFLNNENPVSLPLRKDFNERQYPNTDADYSRVTKSLVSGLPNEVDFALNICTLLSHPGPRLLRVALAPHVITLLVAHTGIYDEGDECLKDLHDDVWKSLTGRDFAGFWACSGMNNDQLELFVPSAVQRKPIDDGEVLTGLNQEYNPKDPISWRIQQVATIVRNLSFESINRVPMATHWPLMKFLLACANCKWAPLYTSALDTLTNIACDINLTWDRLIHTSHHQIMYTIEQGIFSNDKFKLIRCMEMMGGLSTYEGNETILCDFISTKMLEHIFNVVSVKDIMLCVYTLECLYQLSEMGPSACEKMTEITHAIQLLVSMATIEAVSFGKDGLTGMKVVEFHNPMQQISQQQAPPSGHHITTPYRGTHSVQPGPAQHLSTPHPSHVPQFATPQRPQQFRPQPPTQQSMPPPPQIPQHIPTGNFGCDANIERLTFNWIRQNCQYQANAWTARGELYAAYVDDLRNYHHSLSGSLNAFSMIMQNIFPDVQFKISDSPQTPLMAALGVRLIKPHKLVTQQGAHNPQHQSSAPQQHVPIVSQHPLMQQILQKNVNGASNGVSIRPESAATHSNESSRSITPDTVKIPANQICSEAVEARELLHDDSKHEARIVRVENTCRVPEIKNNIARRMSADVKASMETNGVAEGGDEESRETCASSRASTSSDKKEDREEVENEKEAEKENDSEKMETDDVEKTEENKTEKNTEPLAEFMCEWDGCGQLFSQTAQLLYHASDAHLDIEGQSVCKWPGCDATERSKWSLVTHIQDHHANINILKITAQKRRDGLIPKEAQKYRTDIHRELPPHPGYSRNAAIEAIRRHAFNFLPRDITDEPEGPVTRSIRLTSCLILRNLARYSADGRHQLRRHERHLCWLALSRLEGGTALAQLLSELQHQPGEAIAAT